MFCVAVIDEGRPFGAALQEEASNYPPLLLPKGSGGERRGKRPGIKLGQVTLRKRNASKSLLLMSKIAKTISKTAVCQKAAGQVPTEPGYGRNGIRHIGGLILSEAITRNVGTFGVDANGKAASGLNHGGERTDATPRDGALRSSDEVRESGRSEGGCV
jgi:hypothetical protein